MGECSTPLGTEQTRLGNKRVATPY
uniref:Uncharacterized protein n=1 Tax=Rhizophora mucronata TaxID=61149 RepID=A0A2P2IZE1_RHIMU